MDDGTPREHPYVYGDPVTLSDGAETIARCAHCGTPYVPSAHPLDRFCTPRCRDAAKSRRRRRDNSSLLTLRKTLKAHDLLTPATRAALEALRGVGRLPPAEAWARAGLTRPLIVRTARRVPTPTPAPRDEAPVIPAPDPWALPSPATSYVGHYLRLDLRPAPDPAIELRHTRLLHGAICRAAQEPHATGRGTFSLRPSAEGCGWGVLFFDAAVAARVRATTHVAHLGDREVALHFGAAVIRVKAPPPLAAGRYRVTVESVTPLAWTRCGKRVFVRDPDPSTIVGGVARIAQIVGADVPESAFAIRYVDTCTAPEKVFVGGHWQRGTSVPGMIRAITGRLTIECNAVVAWLLLCGARVGLGGCTSLGLGHVRVAVEATTVDAPRHVASRARSAHAVPLSSLSPRTQERLG